MSRISRTTLLVLAARQAARGCFTLDRQRGIARMREAPLPLRDIVGVRKYAAACRLKDATLDLAGLEGEARTRQADRVIALAIELGAMANDPCPDTPYTEEPHEGSFSFGES